MEFKNSNQNLLCDECIEYVCYHNYPCLDLLNEKCAICYDIFTKENVIYLPCQHKVCSTCFKQLQIHKELSFNADYELNLYNANEELKLLKRQLRFAIFNRKAICDIIILVNHDINIIKNDYMQKKLDRAFYWLIVGQVSIAIGFLLKLLGY